MVDFEFKEYSVSDHTYHLTFADVTGDGRKEIVAVTDVENDEHYVSSEIAAASEELMPTATVPDNIGIPDTIERNVRISYFEGISASLTSEDTTKFESSLTSLGDQVLGPDSQRNRPDGESSRKAKEKAKVHNWQGVNPERVDEKDYPTR